LWALASKRLAQIVLYYQQAKMMKKIDTAKKEAELEALKAKYDKKMTGKRKMQTLRVRVCDARGCAGACVWERVRVHARACVAISCMRSCEWYSQVQRHGIRYRGGSEGARGSRQSTRRREEVIARRRHI
jgi:hypothetical protein